MRESINDLATRADWVLPGMEEGRFLTGETTPEGVARFTASAARNWSSLNSAAKARILRTPQAAAVWPVFRWHKS